VGFFYMHPLPPLLFLIFTTLALYVQTELKRRKKQRDRKEDLASLDIRDGMERNEKIAIRR
jgi:hypothetical protein